MIGPSRAGAAAGSGGHRFGLAGAALGVVVVVWASSLSVVKYGVGLGNPYVFNLLRLTAASLLLLPLLALAPRLRRFDPRDLGPLALLALSGHVVFQVGFIHGTHASSASSSALILSLAPVAIAAIAWMTRTEPFCRRTALGLALSGGGILLVSGTEESVAAHLGNLGLFLAMLGWAVYTVRGAAMVRRYGALRVGAWTTGLATLFLWLPAPLLLATADSPAASLANLLAAPGAFWAAAIASGIAALAVGNTLWSYASGRVGPTLTGVYSNVLPLPALAISWVWLGESLEMVRVSGAVLIVFGIAIAQVRRPPSGGRVPTVQIPMGGGLSGVPRRTR